MNGNTLSMDKDLSREPFTTHQESETLVADARAGLTPAQQVENKLATMLKSSLSVSHMQWARPVRR